MIYNCSKTAVVLGRFTLLPGAKVPAVSLTDQEAAAVTRLVQKGILEDDGAKRGRSAQLAQTSTQASAAPAQAAQTSTVAAEDPAPAQETQASEEAASTPSRKKSASK